MPREPPRYFVRSSEALWTALDYTTMTVLEIRQRLDARQCRYRYAMLHGRVQQGSAYVHQHVRLCIWVTQADSETNLHRQMLDQRPPMLVQCVYRP